VCTLQDLSGHYLGLGHPAREFLFQLPDMLRRLVIFFQSLSTGCPGS
jgi:hypothetical protein